jgi:hypothetical protein
MAALKARANSGSVALVAATAKTVLQLVAPTNQRVAITFVGIYLDGATSTAVPVQVRILRQTTAGTSTNAPPVDVEKELTETIQTTAGANFSAEPTAGDVLANFTVPAYQGMYESVPPPDQQLVIQGGGRLGFECTAPAGVNVRITVQFEE